MSELNREDGERSALMQVRKGSDRMAKRRVKQDHHNYTLRDGRIVVKHGVTTEPYQRYTQMKSKGVRFTSMIVDPVAVSKNTALKREKKRVKAHQRSHRGRKPRYNKA